MTQEDRKLLLKDLCSRLLYGIQAEGEYEEDVNYENPFGRLEKSIGYVDGIDHIGFDDSAIYVIIEGIPCELGTVKLYLKPMSSMTEEEDKEFALLQVNTHNSGFLYAIDAANMINWLNAHHFDHCGLIEKGLALEAPEGMYKT